VSAPPQSLEAEESVLGSMLMSKSAIGAVMFLDPDDFYHEQNGLIYKTMLSMSLRGEEVDPITVTAKLPNMKARLHELSALVPSWTNAAHYAKIVSAHAEQRRYLRSLAEATQAAQGGDIKLAGEILSELDSKPSDGLQIVSMANALVDLEDEIRNPPELIGIGTPFSFLRALVGGRVYILAGYQGEGKTAAMGQFVQYAAQAKEHVACFTLEMTWRDLRDRFVSSFGVPYKDLQERRFSSDFAKAAYEQAMMDAAKWQVDLIDKGDLTVADIARVQKIQGYKFIVIDHLHRFDWRERRDIERIVRGIVNIAKEYNVPILLLAQLKRPFGTDRLPRPTMSMLRESGMIEAEAAMVSFVYRPRNEMGLRGMEAEFIIAKNRYGEEGLHKLMFLGDQQRFVEPL
jgi:replicative DNA helicase